MLCKIVGNGWGRRWLSCISVVLFIPNVINNSFSFAVVTNSNTQNVQNAQHLSPKTDTSRRDAVGFMFFCVSSACGLSTWEDFNIAMVRPSFKVRRQQFTDETTSTGIFGAATKNMGVSGKISGANGSFDAPTYNDIMLQHREQNVKRWKDLRTNEQTEEQVTEAVRGIFNAIEALYEAAEKASDYDYDGLLDILHSPALQEKLSYSCSSLRYSNLISESGKEEIGFDWGSCAWRHCGATADAQEAIAELERDFGMLEPFECLFILDIALRSMNDILAIVPKYLFPEGYPTLSEVRMC